MPSISGSTTSRTHDGWGLYAWTATESSTMVPWTMDGVLDAIENGLLYVVVLLGALPMYLGMLREQRRVRRRNGWR
jgi:hypothetical protein